MPRIRFDKAADLRGVAQARQALLEAFAEDGPIEVDTTGVEACDTAFVQLLVAAKHQAERDGRAFSLAAPPSPALALLLDDLALRLDVACHTDQPS